MESFNPDEYLGKFNPDAYLQDNNKLDYSKLINEQAKNEAFRSQLNQENWIPKNIKGALTAPSNLLEGTKQLAYELMNPQQYVNPKTGETSSFPVKNYQAQPRKQYDTSQIKKNRIIAEEAPIGALAGNVATYAPLAFAPGSQSVVGGMGYGTLAGLLQPTTEDESRISNAITSSLLGGTVPVASAAKGKLSNALLNKSEDLVYSALKPTVTQYKSGAAKDAVDTILKTKGLYPSKGGVEKLQGMIDSLNEKISTKVANSTEKVELQNVIDKLNEAKARFENVGTPQKHTKIIDEAIQDFLSHPKWKGQAEISVPQAQKTKQATYALLGDTAYGQIGSAEREAQKAIARGLKEGVASKIPNINELNAAEGKLINSQDVIERAANRHSNKEMGGLAYLMHPMQALAYLVDRNPSSKTALAKALYALGNNKIPSGVVKGTQAGLYTAIPELTQGEQ